MIRFGKEKLISKKQFTPPPRNFAAVFLLLPPSLCVLSAKRAAVLPAARPNFPRFPISRARND